MSYPDTHSIQRQVFEFNVPKEKGTFEAMNRMKGSFQSEILPLMEEVLDELNVPGMTIRLDRIEVDLGNLRPDSLESDFKLAVERELRRELVAHLKGVHPSQVKRRPHSRNIQAQGESPMWLKESGMTNTPSNLIVENEQVAVELLVHILQHGALPWWSPGPSPSLETLVLELLESTPGRLRRSIIPLLQWKHVRRRLALSLQSRSFHLLLELLNPSLPVSWPRLERVALAIVDGGRAMRKSMSHLQVSLREMVLGAWETRNPPALVEGLADTLSSIVIPAAVPEPRLAELQLPSKKLEALVEEAWRRLREENRVEGQETPSMETEGKMEAEKDVRKGPTQEVETIYLDNAGLVLLHPYLQILFQEFDLMEGLAFRDDTAASKALSLLRFLVWGDEEREEYEQALDKVLCGFAPEDAFEVNVELSEMEKAECIQLLEAINSNWKPMEGTSGQDLRDAFLKREGRLSMHGDAWELKVDRKGWDVLLDQLPWTIGFVKLPWMEFPIHLEW